MAEPVHEMSREAVNLLRIAADSGESVGEAALQEQLGVGHDDLHVILDQLREEGLASEVAPGEWSGPGVEEPEPRRVTVAVPDEPVAEEPEPGRVAGRVMASLMPDPTVRLTRAIAAALDAEALGKLVKAGIDDCGDDVTFLMEVVP